MQCPSDVADALVQILNISLLRIRAFAWDGNAEQCSIEADHVHNIPGMIQEFSIGALTYYLETARPAFVRQSADSGLREFEQPWTSLEHFLRFYDGDTCSAQD